MSTYYLVHGVHGSPIISIFAQFFRVQRFLCAQFFFQSSTYYSYYSFEIRARGEALVHVWKREKEKLRSSRRDSRLVHNYGIRIELNSLTSHVFNMINSNNFDRVFEKFVTRKIFRKTTGEKKRERERERKKERKNKLHRIFKRYNDRSSIFNLPGRSGLVRLSLRSE